MRRHVSFLFNNFFELTITGLALGAVYGLVALGYTMVYGVLQLINFAHSEVFMFGTFAVVWATRTPRRRLRTAAPVDHRHAAVCAARGDGGRPAASRCCSNGWPTAR